MTLLPWGDISTRCSIPLQQLNSFHLDMIAQLHVYHPWHWRNAPFSESPHKTLVYKSLAEISPLAKLPSQAVDFQTLYLQSAAQHGPSHAIGITGSKRRWSSCCKWLVLTWAVHRRTGYPAFTFTFNTQLVYQLSSKQADLCHRLLFAPNYRMKVHSSVLHSQG